MRVVAGDAVRQGPETELVAPLEKDHRAGLGQHIVERDPARDRPALGDHLPVSPVLVVGHDAAAVRRFVQQLVVPHPDARCADQLGGDVADHWAQHGAGQRRVGLPRVVDLDQVNGLTAQGGDVGWRTLVVDAGDDPVGRGVDRVHLGVGKHAAMDVVAALGEQRDFVRGQGGVGGHCGRRMLAAGPPASPLRPGGRALVGGPDVNKKAAGQAGGLGCRRVTDYFLVRMA